MLVVVAAELLQTIRESEAWASDYLDIHGVRFDLHEELRQITLHAYSLRKVTLDLGDHPSGDTPEALRARAAFDARLEILAGVWDGLVDRVATIHRFNANLTELDEQLSNLRALQRAKTADDSIAELLRNTAGDELGAEHHRGLANEIAELKALIASVLGQLRGDLHEIGRMRINNPEL
ncbi:hypothetical protein D1871_04695 [Nakamurella silvestris]|nr:hypothetical protein D1871_04695 [Nakamurella silvestris]